MKAYFLNCDGALHTTMVEPSTISEEYEIVWRRPQVDLDELVYLKTVQNYSRKQLSEYFSRPVNTITWYLGRLKKEGRL